MPGKIEGSVVAYGPTGNLVTDIANERLKGVPAGDSVKVVCDEHETVGIYAADHQEDNQADFQDEPLRQNSVIFAVAGDEAPSASRDRC